MKSHDSMKANFKSAKLLVIDDNDEHWAVMQQAMNQALSEVKVARAATAQEAITLLESWVQQEWELPKLILLDLYLPDQEDGLLLIQQIKSLSLALKSTPLIMLSYSGDAEAIKKAYQLGISSYQLKPVDFEGWLLFVQQLRHYWWETVSLPPLRYTF